MIQQEFKYQIFRTQAQWESGLLYRLDSAKDGGIALCPMPAFVRWIEGIKGMLNPCGLAVDECGQIYLIDRDGCGFYRYNAGLDVLEKIPFLGGCGSNPGELNNPGRMIIDKFTLWVTDTGNGRVQAFSRENYQIKYILNNLEEPVDIALNDNGCLYVLDRKTKQISRYDNNGRFIKVFAQPYLVEPAGLAAGKKNNLLVIDRKCRGFITFTEDGEYSGIIGDFNNISADFEPSVIAVNRKGNIFINGDNSGPIHQFDDDGSYLGAIQGFKGAVNDSTGNLYAAIGDGIVLFGIHQASTEKKGIYYSRTLDSGIHDCQWHRLSLKADIPEKCVVDVYYYSSDDAELKNRVDAALSDSGKSTQQKADIIEKTIPWIGPEKNPADMLFREKSGRYLWLKLELSTFDAQVKPAVKQMKVFYPRISYLRYLPAIYQEDPVSKAFLDRFLSIFETASYDIGTEIAHVFNYLDPDTTPQNFLTWLASWLNLSMEEDWPEDKRRRFIKEASALYKLKGAPSGISRLIEIYTGKKPLILEHSITEKPVILSGKFRLGINSILIRTPVRGFSLGDDSILGRVALRDVTQSPEDPFLEMAHRFMVILDLTSGEFNSLEKGLKRILNDEKPAHTEYKLRIVKEMRAGMDAYVGISTRVADYQSIRLGITSVIGAGIVVMDSEKGGRVERHSRIELDTELI